MTDILDFKASPKEFRAWHKTWSSQPSDDGGSVINGMMRVRSIYQSNKGNRYVQGWEWSMGVPIEDVVLLQRTGLYDRNNKKIREGDILSPSCREVKFGEYFGPLGMGTGFYTIAHKPEYDITEEFYLQPFGMTHRQVDQSTVIGNVFENGDLLSTKDQGQTY